MSFSNSETGVIPTGLINRLSNGEFAYNPSGTVSVTNAQAVFSSWLAQTQSSAIQSSQLPYPEEGQYTCARLTQTNATAQRFGIAQIISAEDCGDLREAFVALSGRVRYSIGGPIGFVLLQWSGTPDSAPTTLVQNWGVSPALVNQFFAAGLTVINQGVISGTAGQFSNIPYTPFQCGSGLTNLILFLWTHDAAPQGVTLDIGLAQVSRGTQQLEFEYRPAAIDQFITEGGGPGGAEAANTVFSGPPSGPPAAPTFRALVVADIPTGTSGHLVPLLDGANTWGATQTIAPQSGTTNNGLDINQTGPTSSIAGPINYNHVTISHTANVTGSPGSQLAGGFTVDMNVGGATLGGQPMAASIGTITGVSGGFANLADKIGVLGRADANVTDGTASGWYGGNVVASVATGATVNRLIGLESDTIINTGATAHYRYAFSAVNEGSLQADTADTAFWIANIGAAAGAFQNAFYFSNSYGAIPLSTTADIFHFDSALTIGNIFNAPSLTVTNNIFNLPNVTLTGAGALTVVSLALTGPTPAWTPSDQSGATLTFTSVTAIYTKIGKTLKAQVRLTYPTTASGATASIGGLPFSSSSGGATFASGSFWTNAGGGNSILVPLMNANGTAFTFGNAAGASPTNANLTGAVVTGVITIITN